MRKTEYFCSCSMICCDASAPALTKTSLNAGVGTTILVLALSSACTRNSIRSFGFSTRAPRGPAGTAAFHAREMHGCQFAEHLRKLADVFPEPDHRHGFGRIGLDLEPKLHSLGRASRFGGSFASLHCQILVPATDGTVHESLYNIRLRGHQKSATIVTWRTPPIAPGSGRLSVAGGRTGARRSRSRMSSSSTPGREIDTSQDPKGCVSSHVSAAAPWSGGRPCE